MQARALEATAAQDVTPARNGVPVEYPGYLPSVDVALLCHCHSIGDGFAAHCQLTVHSACTLLHGHAVQLVYRLSMPVLVSAATAYT